MKISKLTLLHLFVFIVFITLGTCQLAKGQAKWLGNVMSNYVPSGFSTYWNQVTLQWAGKWKQVQPSQNTWNWTMSDSAYGYAKKNGIPYKQHTFIWQYLDPTWISDLGSAAKIQAVKTWMQTYCERYPDTDFIDVVNEPIHAAPFYATDLGGSGRTGWDWVITAYQYARQYCPKSKLLLNFFNYPTYDQNAIQYIKIINLLQDRGLIDGVGIQCHQHQNLGLPAILKNLNKLADTGVPLYVSELDLFSGEDVQQLKFYKTYFPVLYEHPAVKGVTLWGYKTNEFGVWTAGLLNDTIERPALTWLGTQYFNSSVNKGPRAFWTSSVLFLTVTFTASKSWDFDGTIETYEWNFGDGTAGSSVNTSRAYTAAGTYIVTLTVTDNQGGKSTFTDEVTVDSYNKPIAYCRQKYIGSTIRHNYLTAKWERYWNQVTPEYAGKWITVEPTKDRMAWTDLDFAYNYAKSKEYLFRGHNFVWGKQIPSWLADLSHVDQASQIEEWMQLYCERYPDYQLLDVVNEPLHETPSYINSIGGLGATGWDWVIWAFQKARQHCPNAKLLINDYGILSETTSLENYILIINLLKTRNLIDGIGLSANYQSTPVNELSANLNTLAATGLPIYISQLDLDISDNTEHLNRIKQLFPLFYQHPSVMGITFWGYIKGISTFTNSWLYDESSTTCNIQTLQADIPLTWGVWNDFTVSIPTKGKIRAVFANDEAENSQAMAVDYAIIDGVKYEAEDQTVNTGVWNGDFCGGSYSQLIHCPGYIEFPEGQSSVTVRARAVEKGGEKLTIQLVIGCSKSSSNGLSYEREALKWLKYTYLPTVTTGKKENTKFKVSIKENIKQIATDLSTDCDGSTVSYSYAPTQTDGSYNVKIKIVNSNGNSSTLTQVVTI